MVVVSTPVSHETVPKSNEGRQVDANYFQRFRGLCPADIVGPYEEHAVRNAPPKEPAAP